MIVAIEGIDAAGKMTQAARLADHLRGAGRRVTQFAFPDYSTETGRLIRAALRGDVTLPALALQSLMTVNRLEHLPLLREHESSRDVLVLDRYWLSGVAYGAAAGLDPRWLVDVYRFAPDALHVVLDVDPVVTAMRRPEARDLYERDREFQERVRGEYLRLARSSLIGRASGIRLVDGRGTVDEVAAAVWDVVALWL